MAWLDDASKLGIERNISKPHQKIFIKAVAARAMDDTYEAVICVMDALDTESRRECRLALPLIISTDA